MKVTVTEFRRDLFRLVEKVIAGESVEFVHKGKTIRLVVPEASSSRLDRLTPRTITNPKLTKAQHEAAERRMKEEMFAAMKKDWAEL